MLAKSNAMMEVVFAGSTVGLRAGRTPRSAIMKPDTSVIDDLSRDAPMATIGTNWRVFTDQVMGGVSRGAMVRETVSGRLAIRMRGEVSLDNNGGFVQMALDLAPEGGVLDASAWRGIELEVSGNGEEYGVHLRTANLTRPWQSYRQSFTSASKWQTIQLPFGRFAPYRTDIPLDTRQLRRIGVVAIGRTFSADLSLGALRYYS